MKEILIFGDSNANFNFDSDHTITVERHNGLKAAEAAWLLEAALADYQPTTTLVVLVLGTNELAGSMDQAPNLIKQMLALNHLAKRQGFTHLLNILPFVRKGQQFSWRQTFDGAHYTQTEYQRIRDEIVAYLAHLA